MGGGTISLVEGARLGMQMTGNDLNPVLAGCKERIS
jgi:adenine-specific DNA methylase